jgi:hypothetical protein
VDFDFLPTQRRVVSEKPSTSVGGFFHYASFRLNERSTNSRWWDSRVYVGYG